ncbi:MAG: extracellular solute-binding protein [Ignavibacteriales bacterium]|nr:MAG: extracellular solute-binding protein [Ignavibacteriales bacterium]
MTKRAINIFLIAVFMISQLSCGNGRKSDANELLYWSSNNSDEITFAKMVVEKWNKEHLGRKVTFQPVPEGQSSEEVILAAVVGETTPDIYSNMWQGDVELYARANRLVALDSLPGFMDFIYSRCDSDVVQEITSSDGHIYQIPWKINPIMLIYNKKVFESVGYKNPPETYSKFIDAAKKLKYGQGETKWIGYAEVIETWWQRLFDFYPHYLAASGGAPLIKNNKVVFNNKYAVQTFAFLKQLFDNGYMPRERISARQDPFLSNAIATRFTGPWEIVHAERFKPEGFEYDFSYLPVPDDFKGNKYTYGDTKNIVIFNTCKNKKLVWEFLKFMVSTENDLLFLKTTNQIPRRKDLITNPEYLEYFNKNPMMMNFAKQAKYVKGPDICPVLKEVFDAISTEYEACVVYGKKTPEQAVNDAAKAANLLLLR